MGALDIVSGSHDYAGLVKEMHILHWKARPFPGLMGRVQEDERAQPVPGHTSNARRSGTLMPVAEAEQRLVAGLRPVTAQAAAVGNAIGRVLAEPLCCDAAFPAKAIALREGWAVASDITVGASAYSPVLVAQEPEWVETGQIIPAGSDAVLSSDGVSLDHGMVAIVAAAAPGEGVRRAGEDAGRGATLRAAGERLRATDVAVAQAVGVGQVAIRTARARIVTLRDCDADMSGGLVAAIAEASSASVERLNLRSRDAASIAGALTQGGADLIVVIGGTGLGRDDHAAEALARAGSLMAHGIALRPGETSGCGLVGATPVILAPGRPEAAFAATLVLALPCLDQLTGGSRRLSVSGRVSRKITSTVGLTELVLLRIAGPDLEPIAVADVTLAAIARAEAWLTVAPDSEGCAAGETVTAFVL
ncbi:MAG TPA: molybdopterin-binding protein [Beijerinckiaceae bacterium]|jgi:molybdopterin biosynthesis enzyme